MKLLDFISTLGNKWWRGERHQQATSIQIRVLSQAAASSRLEDSWSSFPVNVDAHIYQEWTTLVARSREGVENYDHLKKYVQLVRDNVAGPSGFKLDAEIRYPDGELDKLTSDAIEKSYETFSRKGNFDTTGMLSRADAERMMLSTWAADGEVICIVRYGSQFPHGIAFQFVDPMRLDPTNYQKLTNGNVIRHGIEMDEDNRPVAYHFKEQNEQQFGYIIGGRSGIRVPANQIIHWFLPEKVGQKRGLPPARTALWRMRMIAGFEDAAITNARIGASKTGLMKNLDADPHPEPIQFDVKPGVIQDIGNRELIPFTPQFPESTIEIFLRTLLRSSGAGLNVSYHNLANDLTSVNFSSIRQGALDEREVWKGLQHSFREGVVVPMYEKWLACALLNEVIKINGRPLNFANPEKYKSVSFKGRSWPWIDPAAEQAANERAVAQGFKSRSEVIRETSNRDPGDVWSEMEKENIELKKRGIVPLIPSGSVPPSNENLATYES